MKKLWMVLLMLGLIAAVSATAMAVDVKFSGEFYAAGLYLDKTTLTKSTAGPGVQWIYLAPKVPTINTLSGTPVSYRENTSTAFYFQRLRLNTTFVVHPGLFLTTRCDIMERAWGAPRTAPGTSIPEILSPQNDDQQISEIHV